MKKTWEIKKEWMGHRLDLFLTDRLPDFSRSGIQKMIKQGEILVNDKKAAPHHFLKEGDRVSYKKTESPTPSSQNTLSTIPSTLSATHYKPSALSIIDETPDYLVLNKPAGLLVHPTKKEGHGTLIDLLLAHDPLLAKVGGHPDRPGIVHRLDREVSGLMVVAKTEKAFEHLSRQFAQHKTQKTYLALVHGNPSRSEGDIKFRIARSKNAARMAARPAQETDGRAAWSHYAVLRSFVGASLLEIDIYSGRTHQIRAHLFAFSHPVIGDTLYPASRPKRNLSAPRLMLQSVGLAFEDPTTGERKEYRLEPDPAFSSLIKILS